MRNVYIVFSILVIVFSGCSSKKDDIYESNGFGMGTVISQKIFGENSSTASEEVFKKIKYLEELMTINSHGGDINNLNSSAGKGFVKLKSVTFGLIKTAVNFSKISDGAFDITCGTASKSWMIGTESARIPSENEILKLQSLVNYKDIFLDEENKSVSLKKERQLVDLGGIAKGYAGDEAIKIYKKYDIRSACINLGGNVVTLGNRADGSPWSVGIQNPRAANGSYIGIVRVSNKTVVTSGDYERYFEKDGKRYHHIFDPKTCRPSDSGLIGVTIVADSSVDADALSTAVFVLGLEKGLQLIKQYEHADAIFITIDKKVYITEALKEIFTFKDESGEYKYVEKY